MNEFWKWDDLMNGWRFHMVTPQGVTYRTAAYVDQNQTAVALLKRAIQRNDAKLIQIDPFTWQLPATFN